MNVTAALFLYPEMDTLLKATISALFFPLLCYLIGSMLLWLAGND